jgi:excisionase family DNA binding protein
MNSLSIKEAAGRLGVTTVRVLQLIQEGSLPAKKIGRDWFIEEKDVEAAQNRPKRGRPKKEKVESQIEETSSKKIFN